MNSIQTPAFIRPIQTGQLANFPTELLMEIENKLKDCFENTFERQRNMMRFRESCLVITDFSSKWTEVAVYDQRIGELAELLEEMRVGAV